jgi:hypothetical protein
VSKCKHLTILIRVPKRHFYNNNDYFTPLKDQNTDQTVNSNDRSGLALISARFMNAFTNVDLKN